MEQPAVLRKRKTPLVAVNLFSCMKFPIVNLGTGMISSVGAAFVTCGTTCGVTCCVPPVLSLLGLSSYSASYVSFVEPLKPVLIGITVVSLGYAFYKAYRKPKMAISCCNADQAVESCCKPEREAKVTAFIKSKSFLWLVTIFCAFMYAWPYLSFSKSANAPSEEQIQLAGDSTLSQGGCCSTSPDDSTCSEGCRVSEN